jgi:hypothetical protein
VQTIIPWHVNDMVRLVLVIPSSGTSLANGKWLPAWLGAPDRRCNSYGG